MTNHIHLLNGDALLMQFPEEISGKKLVCRECLVEGPVEKNELAVFFNQRAKYLNKLYQESSVEVYTNKVASQFYQLLESAKGKADLYLWFLVGLAVLGTFSWRFLGVVIGDRIPKDSIWSVWINAVAYAMVAGVMLLLVVYPSGLVAEIDLIWRLLALSAAVLVMMVSRYMPLAIGAALLIFLVMESGLL